MLLQTYKLTTGSSNLNAQHKVLCLRDERKICYIYQRKKANFSKIIGGEGNFLFELVTREFKLVTRGFELALLNFNSCFEAFNHAFKLSTLNS